MRNDEMYTMINIGTYAVTLLLWSLRECNGGLRGNETFAKSCRGYILVGHSFFFFLVDMCHTSFQKLGLGNCNFLENCGSKELKFIILKSLNII